MSLKKSLFAASTAALMAGGAYAADSLTIAIVNNGHMINMQKVAEAYTAETGVSLNWVALEEGVLREQVTSDTATGGGQYDIINIGMQEAPIWGAAGWIEPLNFGADYDMDDILPAIRAGLSHEGTMYAAPFYGESSMVMYRKDLTDAAGVVVRDNDSWANIKGAAAAMHDPDNGVYGACLRGKPGWGDNMAFITTVVNSFGGAWFDADMRPTIDTAAWEEAINFYVDLLGNYGPPGSEGNSFNEILALYNEGKCGMWIDATVAASFVTNPKDSTVADHVGFALAPDNGMGVRSNWLWAWALAVPAGTQKEAAAKEFIEWATSNSYIELVASKEGWANVPPGARTSLYENPDYKDIPFAKMTLDSILSADPLNSTVDPSPYVGIQFAAIPEFAGIATDVSQEFSAAYAGQQSIEEALAKAQAITNDAMEAAGYR